MYFKKQQEIYCDTCDGYRQQKLLQVMNDNSLIYLCGCGTENIIDRDITARLKSDEEYHEVLKLDIANDIIHLIINNYPIPFKISDVRDIG